MKIKTGSLVINTKPLNYINNPRSNFCIVLKIYETDYKYDTVRMFINVYSKLYYKEDIPSCSWEGHCFRYIK